MFCLGVEGVEGSNEVWSARENHPSHTSLGKGNKNILLTHISVINGQIANF